MKKIIQPFLLPMLLFVSLVFTPRASAQAVYQNKDYRSKADGNWNANATWETNTTVAGGWFTATAAANNLNPSGGITEITNARTVTTSSTGTGTRVVVDPGGTLVASSTLTLAAATPDASYTNAQGAVDSADLIVAGTNTLTGSMTMQAGATAIVESGGVMNLNGGTLTIGSGGGSLTVQTSGVVQITSLSGSAPITQNGTLTFKTGSKLSSARAAGTTFPAATWESGSTLEIATAATVGTPTFPAAQAYGNFIYNEPAHSAGSSRSLGSFATAIKGDFIVKDANTSALEDFPGSQTAGVSGNIALTNVNLRLAASAVVPGTLNMTGSVFVASNAKLDVTTSAAGRLAINFVGGGSHTFSQGGAINTATKYAWAVASGDALTLVGASNLTINAGTTTSTFTNKGTLILTSNAITGTGIFAAAAGSTTKFAATNAIGAGGNITSSGGNVYDPAASYEFNGTAPQTSGASFPTSAANLTINNNSGVTLNNAITLSGLLRGSGTIADGTVTIAATGGVSPGNSAGTLTVTNLTLNGASTNYFELTNSTTAGGGLNDLLVIKGTLTPNGSTISFSDYGPNSLDVGDYTLVDYSAGSESGTTFNSAPLWLSALTNTPGTIAFIFDDTTNKKILLRVTGGCTAPTATVRSADSTTICSGGSATIHADLTGTGPWLVKWSDESTPDNVSSSPVTRVVSPASTTVYTITSLSDNSGCVAPPTLSGSATVTVNQPPSVTTPAGQTVCVGSTANFTVSAGATTSPNYQWQVDTGGGFGNVSSGTGGNSASYTTATLALGDNNNQYRCIVSSGVACGSPATSGAAILNVSSGGVTINSPPANATNSIGEMAAFSVGASGIGLSFQWQVNTGGGFANVSTGSGGSTSNYTTAVLALADNGSQFQCILTPTCGNASTSSVATLTMIPGNYRTRASGFWTNALTWEESYNSGGNWVSAQITPTAANSTNILIQGSHTVTNTTSISADELVIQSGGLLTVSGSTFTINDGAAAVDCDVLGTIQVLTGGSVVTNAGAGVTFENGSLFQWSNAATPAVPSATWANGSTCKIAATAGGTVNATGVSGQSFYDFTWDTTVAGQSARCRLDIQGSNTVVRRNLAITIPNTASASVTLCNGTNVLLTVGGNVTFVTGAGQNSTKVLLNSAAGQIFFFKVAGNFSAGGFLDGFGSTDSTLEFNGTGNQSLTLPTGSGLITGGAISHQVDNNSILTLNSAISNCKAFAVNNGGQVIFGTNQIANGSMLTLNSTAVIYGNGTNQLANVNTNNYGGTLNITNNLPQVLANGTSFKLFAGGTNNSGSFAAIVPATPGANQVWDTTQLLTNGTLIVASAVVASPVISSAVLSGTDLILSGTNGPANAGYTVFSTTNLAKPLTTWSPVGAGTFNAGGGFSYTNLGTTNPAAFFIIRTP